MKILVTGGAGYIGSHATLALVDAGHSVVVLDNLVYGHRDVVERLPSVDLIVGDIGHRDTVDDIFFNFDIDAVMHFSAYAYVGESVENPSKYYNNNVSATLTLLDAMCAAEVKKIVFSSTCATYGIPHKVPITENMPQNPINPYGCSKLMVERMLRDYDNAYGLKSIVFRYFNAAGADPQGRSGEDHTPETHLIPLVLDVACGNLKHISIFGTDYPTPDGTCIRDYIHVTDLAEAHILGLEYLQNKNCSEFFNLGNGKGYSVREVIDAARMTTGLDIPVKEEGRRPGDPPVLVGSAKKANNMLGWVPRFGALDVVIKHAWGWKCSQ